MTNAPHAADAAHASLHMFTLVAATLSAVGVTNGTAVPSAPTQHPVSPIRVYPCHGGVGEGDDCAGVGVGALDDPVGDEVGGGLGGEEGA